jgi:hypothetical protein
VLSGPDTGSFIVLFKTPAAATLAARSSVFPQSSNSLEAFKVQPAPNPEDMLWQVGDSWQCCLLEIAPLQHRQRPLSGHVRTRLV